MSRVVSAVSLQQAIAPAVVYTSLAGRATDHSITVVNIDQLCSMTDSSELPVDTIYLAHLVIDILPYIHNRSNMTTMSVSIKYLDIKTEIVIQKPRCYFYSQY